MAFPPHFLDQLRSRISIAEVIGKRLDWDVRRSVPAKGDYWACCPFHGEKTPSFHVEDRKGFFYCFGCHEKGDAVGFVMKNDGLAFHEAVELLAGEAGLEMPERDPQAARRAEERKGLQEAMEAAQRFYTGQLAGAAAREARAYLERRGLDRDTIQRFGIGYAPRGPAAVTEHLTAKGFARERLVECGLAGKRDDGTLYDRFRERILFPIRDPKGSVIAFGGRSLDPDARAKYLNSPETPLFSKSNVLYNLGPARSATGEGAAPVVAEGYMDVIALVRHGFETAVAPLGTALTESQLALLWRFADEPVIALDGDVAGLRAAARTANLALPLLAPGKTLRFALMPGGQDPDDLLRESGPSAMRAVLDGAEPLSDFLWRLEAEAGPLDMPERRADFDARLRRQLARIGDESVRSHYAAHFREKRAALFAPKREAERSFAGGRRGEGWRPRGAMPERHARNETRATALASGAIANHRMMLERRIVEFAARDCVALSHCCDSLSELEFANRALDSIRSALISAVSDFAERETQLTVSTLLSETRRKIVPDAIAELERLTAPGGRGNAQEHLPVAIERYRSFCARDSERRDAEIEFEQAGDDRALSRMLAARAAFQEEMLRVMPPVPEEESVSVQSFIDQELWKKPEPRHRDVRRTPDGPPPSETTRDKHGR